MRISHWSGVQVEVRLDGEDLAALIKGPRSVSGRFGDRELLLVLRGGDDPVESFLEKTGTMVPLGGHRGRLAGGFIFFFEGRGASEGGARVSAPAEMRGAEAWVAWGHLREVLRRGRKDFTIPGLVVLRQGSPESLLERFEAGLKVWLPPPSQTTWVSLDG